MGNIFKSTAARNYGVNANCVPDSGPPDPTQIRFPSCMGTEPIISIPIDANMDQTMDKQIKFRVRHAASDFPATMVAHKDHTIATLKLYLIKSMGLPSRIEDIKCKILMVWKKNNLLEDESLETGTENDQRNLGGSIDHLTLGEYGLENGDFLMFKIILSSMSKRSKPIIYIFSA